MGIKLPDYRYCPVCGSSIDEIMLEGRMRPVCSSCGHIIYVNPVPATCLVILDRHKVLLALRGVESQKGQWCLPGGFIEWGESPEEASKRELLEETNITAEGISLSGLYNSITNEDRHVLLIAYRVLDWKGEPLPGDDAINVKWFNINELPSLAFKAHKKVLDDILSKEIVI